MAAPINKQVPNASLTKSQLFTPSNYKIKSAADGRKQICEVYKKQTAAMAPLSKIAVFIIQEMNNFEALWNQKKDGEAFNIAELKFVVPDPKYGKFCTTDKETARRGALFYNLRKKFPEGKELEEQRKYMQTLSFFVYKALIGTKFENADQFIFEHKEFQFAGSNIEKVLKKLAVNRALPDLPKDQKPFDARDKDAIKKDKAWRKEFYMLTELTDAGKGFEHLKEMQKDKTQLEPLTKFLDKLGKIPQYKDGFPNGEDVLRAFHEVSVELAPGAVEKQKAIKTYLLFKVGINQSQVESYRFRMEQHMLNKLTKFVNKLNNGQVVLNRPDKELVKELRNQYHALFGGRYNPGLESYIPTMISDRETSKKNILSEISTLKDSKCLKQEYVERQVMGYGLSWEFGITRPDNSTKIHNNKVKADISAQLANIADALEKEDVDALKKASEELQKNGFLWSIFFEDKAALLNLGLNGTNDDLFNKIKRFLGSSDSINNQISNFNAKLKEFSEERESIRAKIAKIDEMKPKWFQKELKPMETFKPFTAKVEATAPAAKADVLDAPKAPVVETAAVVAKVSTAVLPVVPTAVEDPEPQWTIKITPPTEVPVKEQTKTAPVVLPEQKLPKLKFVLKSDTKQNPAAPTSPVSPSETTLKEQPNTSSGKPTATQQTTNTEKQAQPTTTAEPKPSVPVNVQPKNKTEKTEKQMPPTLVPATEPKLSAAVNVQPNENLAPILPTIQTAKTEKQLPPTSVPAAEPKPSAAVNVPLNANLAPAQPAIQTANTVKQSPPTSVPPAEPKQQPVLTPSVQSTATNNVETMLTPSVQSTSVPDEEKELPKTSEKKKDEPSKKISKWQSFCNFWKKVWEKITSCFRRAPKN